MSRSGLGVTWSSYNHPTQINNTGTGESVQFAYTHTHERWSSVLNSNTGVETTYFIGGLLEKAIGVPRGPICTSANNGIGGVGGC